MIEQKIKFYVPSPIITEIADLLKSMNAGELNIINSQLYVPVTAFEIYADLTDVIKSPDSSTETTSITFTLPDPSDLTIFDVLETTIVDCELENDILTMKSGYLTMKLRLMESQAELYEESMNILKNSLTNKIIECSIPEDFYKVYNKLKKTTSVALKDNIAYLYKNKDDVIELRNVNCIYRDETYKDKYIVLQDLILEQKPTRVMLVKDQNEQIRTIAVVPIHGIEVYMSIILDKPVVDALEELLEEL